MAIQAKDGVVDNDKDVVDAVIDNVTARVIADEKSFLFLHIHDIPIVQWFKEQSEMNHTPNYPLCIKR